MSWSQQVFAYCERGMSAAFWAEPLNAVTNIAFLVAAAVAARELGGRKRSGSRIAEWVLIALVAIIGVGSFLFHTFATRWSAIADTGPIGVFMLAYLAYALRRFVGLGWVWTMLALAGFVLALRYAGQIQCRPGLLSVTEAARGRCLNGTLGYAPAFLAMLGIGAWLAALRHPAWRRLTAASLVFLVSMLFRTVDLEVCAATRVAGRALGTHALWHILNATTLWLLVTAAVRAGRSGAGVGGSQQIEVVG